MVHTFYESFGLRANTYLVQEDVNILIDIGIISKRLLTLLENQSLDAIFLTHGHFDHIFDYDKLFKFYPNVPIYSFEEQEFVENPKSNGSISLLDEAISFPFSNFHHLKEGEVKISSLIIDCFLLKGHTPGGGAFYLPSQNAIFFGDTIFYNGIGRYDLFGGSFHELKESLVKIKNLNLPKDTMCYFGHEQNCTYEELLLHNPYLKEL